MALQNRKAFRPAFFPRQKTLLISQRRRDCVRLFVENHAQQRAAAVRDTTQLLALLHIFQKEGARVEFATPEGRTRLASLKVHLAALFPMMYVVIQTNRMSWLPGRGVDSKKFFRDAVQESLRPQGQRPLRR